MNYTKGEWQVHRDYPKVGDLGVIARLPNGATTTICQLKIPGTGYREEVEANARLIAASPSMYEALKGWSELWEIRPLDSGADMQQILRRCWNRTIQALAKAEEK